MSEIVWLTSDLVQAIHAHQLKPFGGSSGLRDEELSNPLSDCR